MFSYEKNFSPDGDGRCRTSFAAWRSRLCSTPPELEFRRECAASPEIFGRWREQVKRRLGDLLMMPEADPAGPDPVLLKREPRDGYFLEWYEAYPDRWSAVPFLLLRPEKAIGPRPAVLCFPGSHHPKEALAGEPMPDSSNCPGVRFPERNCQALHYVRKGYIALAFDNPGTALLAEQDSGREETQWGIRTKLVQGLLCAGTTYPGWSLFQKRVVLDWLVKQPWSDPARIAVSGHSLGSEIALFMGLLDDRVSAVVFNDFLSDQRKRWCAVTEIEAREFRDSGNWHVVPGLWKYFTFPDMLAALAPKFLAANEGGAEEFLDKVRTAYAACGVPDRFQVSYYPKFADAAKKHAPVPWQGLSSKAYYEDYCSVDVPDHSFRPEPSLKLLELAFSGGTQEDCGRP